MHFQDGEPFGQCGERDHHLPVEPAGAQQRRVEDFRAVGGSQHDNALRHVEPVHLRQELVERLLAFVVRNDRTCSAPALSDGVDLVHEDDAWRPLAGLGKQVSHSCGAYADEQLHETRAAN